MLDPCNPLNNTILIYIISVISIYYIKPMFMYSYKENKFKSFGFGLDKTPLSFPILSISLAIILYIIFSTVNSLCI